MGVGVCRDEFIWRYEYIDTCWGVCRGVPRSRGM